jgi:hypothetical protein
MPTTDMARVNALYNPKLLHALFLRLASGLKQADFSENRFGLFSVRLERQMSLLHRSSMKKLVGIKEREQPSRPHYTHRRD